MDMFGRTYSNSKTEYSEIIMQSIRYAYRSMLRYSKQTCTCDNEVKVNRLCNRENAREADHRDRDEYMYSMNVRKRVSISGEPVNDFQII